VTSSNSNWWETVTKPNASNTGPNCQGRAGCPSATLTTGNAPPGVVTQDGATYENFIKTSGFSGGQAGIEIQAQNVTFRNFHIAFGNNVGIQVIDTPNANFVMEYGEIISTAACSTIMDGDGYTAQFTHFHDCDDIAQVNTSNGNNGPVLVEDSYWHDARGSHGDVFMGWDVVENPLTVRHCTLVGGDTSIFIDGDVQAQILFEENWLYGGECAFHFYPSPGDIVRRNIFFNHNCFGLAIDNDADWYDNLYDDFVTPALETDGAYPL
jgi:hypothetical protein